jgi:hypothetical protein
MPNMRRWSAEKLTKEHVFAVAALDRQDPASVAWLGAVRSEVERRAK